MKRTDEATMRKAEAIFNKEGSIVTGQDLSRKELRQLEREGIVQKRLMKNKDTGSLIYEWKPTSLSEGIIKKP